MAETLRELVVALSLDSSNFSRNMRTINQQIKEAESTFRLAGAGVQNYEKTIAGTEAKLSMLGQKLTQQQRAVERYSRTLVAANDKLKENYDRHQDYTQRLEQAKARQEDLRFEVEAATVAYENYRDSLGETDSATIAAKQNLERYQEEYADATAEVTKPEGQVKALQKTMQNSADAVSKATTDLNNAKAAVKDTEAEIRRLTEQLYRMESRKYPDRAHPPIDPQLVDDSRRLTEGLIRPQLVDELNITDRIRACIWNLSASSGLSFDKGMGCLLFCKVIQIKYNFR